MKKLKFILIIALLLPLNINASTETRNRNELDNLGVNKHWKITDKNKSNVLRTNLVNADEKIYDYSDILTEEEEKEIKNKIDKFIEETKMDMVFVSVNLPYSNDKTNEDFAADFYDYNDFGINFDKYSGVLLLRNTYQPDPYFNVYMFGEAQRYYTFNRAESMLDSIYPYFHTHQYYQGLNVFIDYFTNYYHQGIPNEMKNYYIDENSILHKKPRKYKRPLILIVIADLLSTLLIGTKLVNKNKMVRKKISTIDYADKNGVNFTRIENNKINEYVTHHTHVSTYSGGGGAGGGGFSSSIGSSGGGHTSGGGRHG